MTDREYSDSKIVHSSPLYTRGVQGATVAVVLIILAFIIAGDPAPSYLRGNLRWMILPFLFVPVAGALGGFVYYYTDFLRYRGGWHKTVANTVSIIIYGLLVLVAFLLGMNGSN